MLRFLNALRAGGGRRLFHFTDRRNLGGIRQHGLLSLRELRSRHVPVPAPGGNDWSHDADTRLKLDRYVHLCLFDQHPMEYKAKNDGRIAQSIFLHVDPAVLNRPGVMFCDEVSNKAGAIVRPLRDIDDYLDLQLAYGYSDWKDQQVQQRLQAIRKFEILVPDHVPIDLLGGF